jgi:hypothetical protein
MKYRMLLENIDEIQGYRARFANYSPKDLLEFLEVINEAVLRFLTLEEAEKLQEIDEIPLSALEKRFPEYFLK